MRVGANYSVVEPVRCLDDLTARMPISDEKDVRVDEIAKGSPCRHKSV